MDKLQPRFLTRQQLAGFLGNNQELIKAFETFVDALSTAIPDELSDLQLQSATVTAMQEAMSSQAEQDRRDAEAVRLIALSAQVEQLREQLAAMSDHVDPTLAAAVAVLREEMSSMSIKPKRVQGGSIMLSGTTFGTFTFVPAITGLAELRHLGTQTNAANFSQASVAISLSGSTVTATRLIAGGTDVTVNFEITEF